MDDQALLQNLFPLQIPLHFPPGESEESIYSFLQSVRVGNANETEMYNYCAEDWRRFVITFNMLATDQGSALELGSNPYFTTMLLRRFTKIDLTLANYFSLPEDGLFTQEVHIGMPNADARQTEILKYHHFNIESGSFPFPDASFEQVLFCEILEHLQQDPLKVLREIKRVLKPDGHLILTTPNVARLENVSRMLAGENIYDPYSGYGPYGRHNREYTKHEIHQVLTWCGFEIESLVSSDVHPNRSLNFCSAEHFNAITPLIRRRERDLGQYLFCRARNRHPTRATRPDWLYRSYSSAELEQQ